MQISDLPDYAALQQIARALWKEGKTRGAAVLVGAGFSRNAQLLHDGGNNPPLWNDLANEMQRRLDPSGTPCKDPLRLAEEFRVVLGEPALEGLIRDHVTDEEWLPSELHKRLVQLPWVDILTTNWDTLLERAADSVIGHSYETVRSLEDVAPQGRHALLSFMGAFHRIGRLFSPRKTIEPIPDCLRRSSISCNKSFLKTSSALLDSLVMIQTFLRGPVGFVTSWAYRLERYILSEP
jgi:hypothetical protein